MSIEIERKFKVNKIPWTAADIPYEITQGYISLDSGRTVRVRTLFRPGMKSATLTIKGEPIDISRTEFEYEIPYGDALQMLDNGMCLAVLKKRRYKIPYDDHVWDVDEFLGHNSGLILAEIELKTTNEAWQRPDWIDHEVTHDPRYYNSRLALQPING
jgi:CYTH domain-containing protein